MSNENKGGGMKGRGSIPNFEGLEKKKYPSKSPKLTGNRRVSVRAVHFRDQLVSGEVLG